MVSKYGELTADQLDEYRERLHKKLFWLLLYKDPNTKEDYSGTNFDRYFLTLMMELKGLDEVLVHPNGLVEILCILEAAFDETKKDPFEYSIYRKFVLDAHSLLDRMDWGTST